MRLLTVLRGVCVAIRVRAASEPRRSAGCEATQRMWPRAWGSPIAARPPSSPCVHAAQRRHTARQVPRRPACAAARGDALHTLRAPQAALADPCDVAQRPDGARAVQCHVIGRPGQTVSPVRRPFAPHRGVRRCSSGSWRRCERSALLRAPQRPFTRPALPLVNLPNGRQRLGRRCACASALDGRRQAWPLRACAGSSAARHRRRTAAQSRAHIHAAVASAGGRHGGRGQVPWPRGA